MTAVQRNALRKVLKWPGGWGSALQDTAKLAGVGCRLETRLVVLGRAIGHAGCHLAVISMCSRPGTAPWWQRELTCGPLMYSTSFLMAVQTALIDDPDTFMQIESLRRFMPQLLYIRQPGVLRDPAASPNTAVANSLGEVFAAT